MRFYTKQHNYYCGIDLHTNKMYLCILDQEGEVVLHRNIKTKPDPFLRAIKPYRDDIVVCAECMFTWYWLADLCVDQEILFVLGHALYMRAIHGGKSKHDKIDSRKIAGLLPMAYVYPRKMRATRDLMRRRNHLMRKRAELLAHIQNTASQYNLLPLGSISKATSYALLKTIPGVGKILALVLLYEIENIARFPRVQNFSSYCRLVKCAKESNGKKYGELSLPIHTLSLRAFQSEAELFFDGFGRLLIFSMGI